MLAWVPLKPVIDGANIPVLSVRAWIRYPMLHKVDQMIEFTRERVDVGKIREVLGLGTHLYFVT